jgi:mono/diheme cytochrome c family protein
MTASAGKPGQGPTWVRLAGPLLGLSLLLCFGLILLPGGLRSPQPELEEPADPTDFAPVRGEMTEPIDLAGVLAPTPELLDRGKTLFDQTCVSCHGATGMGDGPAGAALKPPARNLTSPDGWTNGYDLAALYRTLSKGVPGTSMVAYDFLSPQDRFALAHYVQSLGSFDHGAVSDQQMAALDQEFGLSRGVQKPNKAPVRAVVANMSQEADGIPPLQLPKAADTSPGAELARNLVSDPARAAYTLRALEGLNDKPALFASAVTSGTPGNGFSPTVATLDSSQWQTFHQTLLALAPGDDGSR